MHGRRASTGLLAAAVGLAGAVLGPAGARAADTWGPVADLSGSAGSIRGAEVAVDPRGGFLAGWARGGRDRARVFLATRPESGAWTEPTPVPGTRGVGELDVAVAADGERVLVWTVGRTLKASRKAPGRPWTDPAVLHRSRPGSLPGYVDLAVNRRGRAVVAWQTMDDDADLDYVRTRVQAVVGGAAGRWSGVETLSSKAHAAAPEVAVDRTGRVTVAWTEWGRRHSWVMVGSREVGEGWDERRALSRRTADTGLPQLAANEAGDVAVAWHVRGEDLTAIRLRRWERFEGWLPTRSVPGIEADIWWMDAGIDGVGTATVAWSNAAHAVWAATQDSSGGWDRERVAPSGSVYYGMNVVVNELGDTLVGWESRSDGDHPVEVAHRPRSSGWGSPVALSVVPGDAFGPALALARDGNAVAAWTFARDITRPLRVQARVLDAG